MFLSANNKDLSDPTDEKILQSLLDQAVKLYADISISMENTSGNDPSADVEKDIYKLRQGEITQLVEDISFSMTSFYDVDKQTDNAAIDSVEIVAETKEQSYIQLIHQFDDAIRDAVKNDVIDGNDLLLDLAMEIQDYDEDFLKSGEPLTMMSTEEKTKSDMIFTPAKNPKFDGMITRLEQLQLLVNPSSPPQLSSSNNSQKTNPIKNVKNDSLNEMKKKGLEEKTDSIKLTEKDVNDYLSKDENSTMETKRNDTNVVSLQETNPSEGIVAALSVGAAVAAIANYVPGVESAISPIISTCDKIL